MNDNTYAPLRQNERVERAMHTPLQSAEPNEAQERADPVLFTLGSLVWPAVKFLGVIAAVGFLGYVLWAAN